MAHVGTVFVFGGPARNCGPLPMNPPAGPCSNSSLVLLRTFGGFVVAWLFVIQDPLLRWIVRFAHLSMSAYGLVRNLPILGYGE